MGSWTGHGGGSNWKAGTSARRLERNASCFKGHSQQYQSKEEAHRLGRVIQESHPQVSGRSSGKLCWCKHYHTGINCIWPKFQYVVQFAMKKFRSAKDDILFFLCKECQIFPHTIFSCCLVLQLRLLAGPVGQNVMKEHDL